MTESVPPRPADAGAGDDTLENLAHQVARLTDELEAARIERDQYKAASRIMSQALEQMNGLLSASHRAEPGD